MVGLVSTGNTPTETEAAHSGDDHAASAATPAVEANPDAAPYALRDPRPPARGEGDGVTLVPGGAPDGGDLIKEGVHLAAGNERNWGSQAVDLGPAQGAVIEMNPAEDGTYAFVNHAFDFPGRGAIGLFNAS